MDNNGRAEHIGRDCMIFGISHTRLVDIVAALKLKPRSNPRANTLYDFPRTTHAPADAEILKQEERAIIEEVMNRDQERARLDVQERIIAIAHFKTCNDGARRRELRRISMCARELGDALKGWSGPDEKFLLMLNHLAGLGASNGVRGRPTGSRALETEVLNFALKLYREVAPPGQPGLKAFVTGVFELLGMGKPTAEQLEAADKRLRGVKKEKPYSPKLGGGKY